MRDLDDVPDLLEAHGQDHGIALHLPGRPASVPALVPLFRQQPLRLRDRIDVLRFEPLDPGQTVASLAASFGIEEVVGERLGLALSEAEGAQPGQGVFGLQPR